MEAYELKVLWSSVLLLWKDYKSLKEHNVKNKNTQTQKALGTNTNKAVSDVYI